MRGHRCDADWEVCWGGPTFFARPPRMPVEVLCRRFASPLFVTIILTWCEDRLILIGFISLCADASAMLTGKYAGSSPHPSRIFPACPWKFCVAASRLPCAFLSSLFVTGSHSSQFFPRKCCELFSVSLCVKDISLITQGAPRFPAKGFFCAYICLPDGFFCGTRVSRRGLFPAGRAGLPHCARSGAENPGMQKRPAQGGAFRMDGIIR